APGASMQQRVADGLGKVRAHAGSFGAAMVGIVASATSPPTPAPSPAPTSGTSWTPAASAASPGSSAPGAAPSSSRSPPSPAANGDADPPIPGYDVLSASQVIERLEGLSPDSLERIRVYELAHRARRTILASIDQLTS